MSKVEPYPRWRLLQSISASGFSHMALDQALLESAVGGDFIPTLRFYRWSPAAISLGRFQDIGHIDVELCRARYIDVVRRPTGGGCILHMDDFTYSLVLPPPFSFPDGVTEGYKLICTGIITALGKMGLQASIKPTGMGIHSRVRGACFSVSTHADLEYQGRKICGSAQLRRHKAVLQHGSLLIDDHSNLLFELLHFSDNAQRSRALADYHKRCISLSDTGLACKWDQVAACFVQGFQESFGVDMEMGRLNAKEESRWHTLTNVYASSQWLLNAKSDSLPVVD